ncbi:hypothetical protein, partial [Nitrobacter sp.]
ASKKLLRLEPKTMRESGYWERRDIQNMICRSPDAFCNELGEDIRIVGTEIQPTEFVQDRIDLLGVDPDGVAVVIELKRDSDKLQLLQGLSYAAMLSKWEPYQFIDALANFNGKYGDKLQTIEEAQEEIGEILEEGDIAVMNRSQRVLLLAEEFDYGVLATAEWLWEKFELDIRCYRLQLARHDDLNFLTCTRVYPPPELSDIAIRRRRTKEIGLGTSATWDDVYKTLQSDAVCGFFRSEVLAGVDNLPGRRRLIYRRDGRSLFRIGARKQFATVHQFGRFENDESYWRGRLAPDANVRLVRDGKELRFRLQTENDFAAFKSAWRSDLTNRQFFKDAEDAIADGEDLKD